MSGNSYNGFTWSQRQRAYDWLKNEWKCGRRVRPELLSCDVCGQQQGHRMAHSEDYSAPYGPHIGQWTLCYWCHMLLHCRFRAPVIFASYASMLEAGERFMSVPSAQWARVQGYLSGRSSPPRELHGQHLDDPFGPLFFQGSEAIARNRPAEESN